MHKNCSSLERVIVLIGIAACLSVPLSATTYVYADTTVSGTYVVGIGTTDTNYAMSGQHTAYATVTVTSPTNRTSTTVGSALNRVTAYDYLPMLPDDGVFSILNVAKEWCPAVHVFIFDGNASDTNTISPYVYLSSVSWSKSSIGRKLDVADLIITAGKSNGCHDTTVSLQANFSSATPGLLFAPATGQTEASFTGNTAVGRITTGTTDDNPTAGNIQGDGLLTGLPTCAKEGGLVKTASPNLTVN